MYSARIVYGQAVIGETSRNYEKALLKLKPGARAGFRNSENHMGKTLFLIGLVFRKGRP